MELMDGLNESQRATVTATEGCIRVLAGAGSGKTRALSRRFAFLVREIGVLPSNILCVTFTNKAANEMRLRIRQLTGDDDTGYICTFHSFCVSVLHEDAHAVQYPENFLVLDNADIDAILALIYEERGITLRQMTFKAARDMFELRKGRDEPEYYEDMIAMPLDILRQKYLQAEKLEDILFYGYLYQEKKCFGLDYNDLIKFTLHIFTENPEIRTKWQKRLEYIMVDEFQDIDKLQYKLLRVLYGYHKNLFLVGDPDQTIYSWRGANVRYLLEFPDKFPGTRTIFMMQNYRSTPEILAVANSLIAKNKNRVEKNLSPIKAAGTKPLVFHARDSREEAEWIADRIQTMVKAGQKLSEIAVLYRAHYVTRVLEEVLQKESVPYTLYSGVQFYDRSEIKDALSYLRLLAFHDDLSFARIVNKPKRNIGNKRMRFLRDYAEERHCLLYDALRQNLELPLFQSTKAAQFVGLIEDFSQQYSSIAISELLGEILERSGYEELLRTEGSSERLNNLAELKQAVFDYETTCGEEAALPDYLSHVALFSNADIETPDTVRLMTVHAAKGLEFPVVFLCSLDEGIFPARKTASQEAMEEERRLAFVALTRAQDQLYLSDAEGLNLRGACRYPSRFLLDIDENLLDWVQEIPSHILQGTRDEAARQQAQQTPAEDELFPVGARVSHTFLGPGTILAVDLEKKVYQVRFDDLQTERSIRFQIKLKPEDAS